MFEIEPEYAGMQQIIHKSYCLVYFNWFFVAKHISKIVAQLIENKGLSCLYFPEFQPLEKIVAYKRCL